jgi:site-specific DNA recombinase
MPENKIAATYRRVSLDELQSNNYSLASQDRAMEKLAKEKHYATSSEFNFLDDGYLGGEFDRPALTRLRAAVRAGLIDTVIVYDLDRLARKLAHQLVLVEEFEKHNVKLEVVNAPLENNPEGKMLMSMRGVFAEFEKAKFAERSKRGQREKALQGHIVCGTVPYGYRYAGKAEGKRGEMVVVPEQAAAVRRVFMMAAEGVRLPAICLRLDEEGVRPLRARHWSKRVISSMLSNTTYYGEARYNRAMRVEPKGDRRKPAPAGKSKKTSAQLRPESDWIIIPVPAIVDRELFDRARAQMATNKQMASGRPSQHMLRGLLKCGACGYSCCVYPCHGKPRYRCNNVGRIGTAMYQRLCPQLSFPVAAIEATVWQAVLDLEVNGPELFREYERENATIQSAAGTAKQRADLERAIGKLKTKEFRATQAMLDPELTDAYETFRAALKDCQKQRRTLEAQLEALRPAVKARPAFKAVARSTKRLDALKTPEARREAIRRHVSRIDMLDGVLTIHFRPDDGADDGGTTATYCVKPEPAQPSMLHGFSIRRKVA